MKVTSLKTPLMHVTEKTEKLLNLFIADLEPETVKEFTR